MKREIRLETSQKTAQYNFPPVKKNEIIFRKAKRVANRSRVYAKENGGIASYEATVLFAL